MALERIGIIGAGQMGTGIAHVLALAGYDVMLDDLNKDALGKALDRIEKNMQRQAAKGIIAEDVIKPARARIRTTQTLDDLKDRELVIEALKVVGVRLTVKQAAKYVPIAGQALSVAIGFAAMQYVGRQHIRECARVSAGTRQEAQHRCHHG